MFKLIKKIGLRRFWRVFWATFRAKYFPKKTYVHITSYGEMRKHSGSGRMIQATSYGEVKDRIAGRKMFLSVVIAAVFICLPVLGLMLKLDTEEQAAMNFSIPIGLFFLVISVVVRSIPVLKYMADHADELLDKTLYM